MKPKLDMPPGKVTYVKNYVVVYQQMFPKERAEELFNQGYRLVGTILDKNSQNESNEYIFERMTMEGLDINEFRAQEATHASI